MKTIKRIGVLGAMAIIFITAACSGGGGLDPVAGEESASDPIESEIAGDEAASDEAPRAEAEALESTEVLKGIADRCSDFCPRQLEQSLEGGCGCVSNNRVYACDRSADGRGVTTFYIVRRDDGTQAGGNVGDSNGNELGCGDEGPDVPGRIESFHVCVGNVCGPQIGPL